MHFRIAPWTLGLAVIGGLGIAAFLAGIHLDLSWLRLSSKAVPVLCLAVWLWPPRERYAQWIAAGLVLSLVGDMVLEVDEQLFLPALGAFLLAHVAYAAAYLTVSRTPRWGLGALFLLFGAGIWLFLRPGLGTLAPPVGVYIAVICTMMWRSAALMGAEGLARREQWAALIGALCFGLSDALLAFRLFVHPVAGMSYVSILLYWAGQLGIAFSAVSARPQTQGSSQAHPLANAARDRPYSHGFFLEDAPAVPEGTRAVCHFGALRGVEARAAIAKSAKPQQRPPAPRQSTSTRYSRPTSRLTPSPGGGPITASSRNAPPGTRQACQPTVPPRFHR